MKIKKIWFADERIYGETDDGRVLWQSLLYYKRLGISQGVMTQYVNGTKKPSVECEHKILQEIKNAASELQLACV